VKDPSGAQIHDSRDKISDKFEFIVQKRGLHRFCFNNKSPYHETIDFDVHVGHFSYFDQHAKDGNDHPLHQHAPTLTRIKKPHQLSPPKHTTKMIAEVVSYLQLVAKKQTQYSYCIPYSKICYSFY
jgi:emp24/gp25L/p24 family/GOLD